MSAYNTINRITSQMIEHARRNPDEIPPDIDWDGDENLEEDHPGDGKQAGEGGNQDVGVGARQKKTSQKLQDHVDLYDWLLGNLNTTDVSTDIGYQDQFKNYWGMRRLPPVYIQHYFQLLEQEKWNSRLSPDAVCRLLHQYAGNFQFVFATKLTHMVRPDTPIIDSVVRRYYAFHANKTAQHPLVQRIEEQMLFYDFLIDEYKRVLTSRLLEPAMRTFRTTLMPKTMTDLKVVDSLIWICG